MAWARIDDKFLDNPKVRKAGKDATYLYVSGLIYSSNQLTEGFISDEALGLVAYKGFIKNELTHASILVECELWDRVEGGYQIHDYLDYNPTKEQIEEARAKKQAAGSKGAQSRWQTDSKPIASAIATPSKTDSKPIANLCDTDGINPSHPIPLKSNTKNSINQSSSLTEKGDDDDDIYSGFESIAACTPQTKKAIDQAVETYGKAWVKDAIAEGVVHDAKSFAYVSKILASWKANGKPSNGKQSGADIEKFRELYRQQKRGKEC